MIDRDQLVQFLNSELQADKIRDYCPNGLQVEGKAVIRRVITGVTASQALVDAAIASKADAVLVHHGYFWKNEPAQITGIRKKRLQALLTHDINLIAYHLPLDVHPVLGNNAQLGKLLGVENITAVMSADPSGVVMQGRFATPRSLPAIGQLLERQLSRQILVHDAGIGDITTVAWCTGGGQGYIEQAADAGAQLFITGEVSEKTIHLSRERGIHFIAAGHHATERYGIKALGEFLQQQLQLDVQFIDIDNPA
ncbi:Nif3-like dinuclear metal center hexameric protein [Chromatiaceae bacterium AAb-1]|nr:Nif3-like dinuclear metal center hexameric protein [Chromatiaceae bacterium AAb-1]